MKLYEGIIKLRKYCNDEQEFNSIIEQDFNGLEYDYEVEQTEEL